MQCVEKGFYRQRFYTAIVLLAPTLEGEVCNIEVGLVGEQCGQLLLQESLEVRLLFVELLYRMGGFVVLLYEAAIAWRCDGGRWRTWRIGYRQIVWCVGRRRYERGGLAFF
ncbi:hypothetical protein DXU77_13770 [Pseudomonas lactis]|nr:hypothetical protein [Pseudomonas lactis]